MADISKIKLPGSESVYDIKDSTARQMIENLPTPMQFKGSLGVGGTYTKDTLPAPAQDNEGWTLKVITSDTYRGVEAKAGDTLISNGELWICIPSGDEPSGTVTNIATGAELTGGPITSTGTISHATSGVTAGTAQGITVNAYGHVTAIEDMGYAPSASPTFTGNVDMKGADKVEAPILDFSEYDETTQGNYVVTMATLMQILGAVSKTDITGSSLVLSLVDKIQGTNAILNATNSSVEDTTLLLK